MVLYISSDAFFTAKSRGAKRKSSKIMATSQKLMNVEDGVKIADALKTNKILVKLSLLGISG